MWRLDISVGQKDVAGPHCQMRLAQIRISHKRVNACTKVRGSDLAPRNPDNRDARGIKRKTPGLVKLNEFLSQKCPWQFTECFQ